jgi:hypothetical protein
MARIMHITLSSQKTSTLSSFSSSQLGKTKALINSFYRFHIANIVWGGHSAVYPLNMSFQFLLSEYDLFRSAMACNSKAVKSPALGMRRSIRYPDTTRVFHLSQSFHLSLEYLLLSQNYDYNRETPGRGHPPWYGIALDQL